MKKTIILISGKKRAGKDFTADTIIEELDMNDISVDKLSFAFPLKDIMAKTFNISIKELDEYKNNNEIIYKDDESIFTEITNFREILQRFGTDAMRNTGYFPENIWAQIALNTIEKLSSDVIIIPDWRFKNESSTLYELKNTYNIITLRVDDYELDNTDTHKSETELDDFDFDYIINNTPINGKKSEAFLKESVWNFLKTHQIIHQIQ